MKKLGLNLLKAAVSAGLGAYIILTFDVRVAYDHLRGASVVLVAVIMSLHFAGFLVSALRWRILLKAQGVLAPFWQLVGSYMIGAFFGNVTPGGLGGDVLRAYDASRRGSPVARSVNVVVLERLLGLAALSLLAGAALLGGMRAQLDSRVVLLIAGLNVGLGAVVLSASLRPTRKLLSHALALLTRGKHLVSVRQELASWGEIATRPRALALAAALSLLYQVLIVFIAHAAARAVGVEQPLPFYFAAVPVVSLVSMLPISINGIGVREGAFAYLFGQVGVGEDQALAVSVLFYVLTVVASLSGGVLYVVRRAACPASPRTAP